ncbi:polyprenyl synthetase family protein [Sapientia aquatica]|uniref:Polyprenyl synthetase family protein n=1 Tax=Sapientia aquatica TaxID=1549640 RepID=A0A4R5VPV4_9BURK|nr:polyprenyl synthetase family protein [Sapientia aquatica]TDK59644.1 hypothetical protein E2I14_18525 [Sapientia aquatica]
MKNHSLALIIQVEKAMLDLVQVPISHRLRFSSGMQDALTGLLNSSGSMLRARLALSCGKVIGLSDDDCVCIATAAELLHSALLIHDDIQNNEQVNRALARNWQKFETNLAVSCGDLFLSASFCAIAKVSKPRLIPILLARMSQLASQAIYAQSASQTSRSNRTDLDTYIEIARAKSGMRLSLPMELALLLADKKGRTVELAQTACMDFAVGFQIYDDLIDFIDHSPPLIQSADSEPRLNIVSIFDYLNQKIEQPPNPIASATDFALRYLDKASNALFNLPFKSGSLLEGYIRTLECVLGALTVQGIPQ